jgi:threonine aldolase
MRSFASDNNAPAAPEVLEAIAAANRDDAVGYGDDPWTAAARARFEELVGSPVQVLFTFNGTGANVLALAAMLQPYHAVLCASTAHIHTDECGAPERFIGAKTIPIPSEDGKLTPQAIVPFLSSTHPPHQSRPRVISVSQSTELGTVYTIDELRTLAEFAHEHGLLLHVDGARLANAAASLECDLRLLTRGIGADAVSLGMTKNGGMLGDLVLLLSDAVRGDAGEYARKQAMQLASKMRFIAAQADALFRGDLWLRLARRANAMARRLAELLAGIPNVRIIHPVQANAVFAAIPRAAIAPLRERFFFYVFDETRDVVRWMTSWATREDDVVAFADAIRKVCSQVA